MTHYSELVDEGGEGMIQRYEPCTEYIGTGDYVAGMKVDEAGDYVAYDDHRAALDAEKARAAKELDEARDAAERYAEAYGCVSAERDALRAEVERLASFRTRIASALGVVYGDADCTQELEAVERLTKERDEATHAGELVRILAERLRAENERLAKVREAAEEVVSRWDLGQFHTRFIGALRTALAAARGEVGDE